MVVLQKLSKVKTEDPEDLARQLKLKEALTYYCVPISDLVLICEQWSLFSAKIRIYASLNLTDFNLL